MLSHLQNTSDERINPATEDKQDDILVAVQNGCDYVVSAAYTATITATAVLLTAFTATLPTRTVRVVLIPRGDVYYEIGGAASASTAKLPAAGISMPVTKTLADTIQVYAAGDGVVCDLLVCTPR